LFADHCTTLLPAARVRSVGAVNPCLDPTDPGYMCVAGDYGYM